MRMIKKIFVLLILYTMALAPVRANAEEASARELSDKSKENIAQGATDGKEAARRQVKWHIWYGCGCMGNLIGIGIAALAVSEPKEEQLLGKPPLYAVAYTDAYRSELRSRQVRYAAYGCATALLVSLPVLFAFYNTAEEANCFSIEGCTPGINCGGETVTCGEITREPSGDIE